MWDASAEPPSPAQTEAAKVTTMAVTKVPPKSVPWLLVLFGILGLAGLVGLMTDNHIWPFK